ncbi:MAG: c-type cytochrome [Myxococcota bacterium]|nr:c-type cytochrome [Myxococcota bacterium]
MRAVFLRILGFVIVIDLFYMGIGRLYLSQSEEHPPVELQITVETDTDTLVGMGETLLGGKGGCLLCHKITEVGNTRGPDLRGVGGRAGTRRPGMSAEAYLTESLVDPGAYVVEEFATAGGESIMPVANRPPAELSPTEMKAMVGYLQSLGGEVTVQITAQDVAGAEARKAEKPAPTSTHPGFALLTSQGCTACHDVIAETRRIGPPLTSVALRLSAAEIRQSIVDPDAVVAEGYQQGLMLQNFADTLSEEQLDQLVGYLSGEVSMGERLAHPGVHLFLFIVFFNGVVWAMRKLQSAAEASEASGAGPLGLPWRPVGSVLGLSAVFAVVYLGLWAQAPESPTAGIQTAVPTEATSVPTQAAGPPDGKALFGVTCTACHGPAGKGVPGLGKDMTNSAFIDGLSDSELADFIEQGRAADDPLNTTGVAMPPNGLNTALSADDRMAIARFIRSLGN